MTEIPTTDVMEFRLGRVFARSLSIASRNILPFGLIALVLSLPINTVSWLSSSGSVEGQGAFGIVADMSEIAILAGEILFGFLIEAALVIGTLQSLGETKAGIGERIAQGLLGMIPALGVCVLLTIVSVLLIVPMGWSLVFAAPALVLNLYIPVLLWVAVQVAVVEQRGFASLARSLELTDGYRWRIFFMYLIILVIYAGLAFLILPLESADRADNIGYLTANWILSAAMSMISAVVATVSYHDLRMAREGPDPNRTAAIFD